MLQLDSFSGLQLFGRYGNKLQTWSFSNLFWGKKMLKNSRQFHHEYAFNQMSVADPGYMDTFRVGSH